MHLDSRASINMKTLLRTFVIALDHDIYPIFDVFLWFLIVSLLTDPPLKHRFRFVREDETKSKGIDHEPGHDGLGQSGTLGHRRIYLNLKILFENPDLQVRLKQKKTS